MPVYVLTEIDTELAVVSVDSFPAPALIRRAGPSTRKKFKELFACRRPGARDDGGSRERFLRNNGKFGKRAKPRDFFYSLGTSAERANGAVLRFARFAPPSVAG